MYVQYVDITQTVRRTGTSSVYIVLEYFGRNIKHINTVGSFIIF